MSNAEERAHAYRQNQDVDLSMLINMFCGPEMDQRAFQSLGRILNNEGLTNEDKNDLNTVHDYLSALVYALRETDLDVIITQAEKIYIEIDGFLTAEDVANWIEEL